MKNDMGSGSEIGSGSGIATRRAVWNPHIERMKENTIVRIVRDKSPKGRRSSGRPKKRWNDNITEPY